MQAERLDAVRAAFHRFAQVEAPRLASPTYAELAEGVSMDDRLLEMAGHAQPRQPEPNMLLAAVQYLLLGGLDHPLAAHYPVISAGTEPPKDPAFPRFRDFCLTYRDPVVELVRTRRTQTNVVRRCTCLLPAFSLVCREAALPLALVDLGAGAGLNLNFDRYAYSYRRAGREVLRWGPAQARIRLQAELRGPNAPPLSKAIPVASRDGIDVDPVDLADPDQLRWQRALIWPEHVERHRQLVDAAAEFGQSAIRMHAGDAAEVLPALIGSIPGDLALLVYSTIALYQFPGESRRKIADTLCAASAARPVWQVALEGSDPQLAVTRYRNGARETETLADASAHGWWVRWR